MSTMANRKFNATIDKVQPRKFMLQGAEIKDLVEKKEEEEKYYVELY